MSELVSIVIPTYNHARFLGRALQSVMDQSYPHWEALVVDNHSDDNTEEVIDSFKDDRITALKIRNGGIIARSRNLGIREAQGSWIAFLDSDDLWYREKLETLMATIASTPGYDVISNDELVVNTEKDYSKILRYGPAEDDLYQAMLLTGNRLSTSATLVRKTFLVRHSLRFSESLDHVTVEDYGLWLELARLGANFCFVRDILGEYVVHGANASAQSSTHFANTKALLREHVLSIQSFQPSAERLWEKVELRLDYTRAWNAMMSGRRLAALKIGTGALLGAPGLTASLAVRRLRKNLRLRRHPALGRRSRSSRLSALAVCL